MTVSSIIKLRDQSNWEKEPRFSEELLEAETKEAFFAAYFKQYDNRRKYLNGSSEEIADPELAAEYRVWISDVSNYANNGGDMW